MFGFDHLSLRDLAALCREITDSTEGAATMEDAAARVVRCLRYVFGTRRHGRTDIVLARAFQTVAYADLTPDLREYVDARQSGAEPPERCLVLLGTDGDLPAWCDRRTSAGHRALPLGGPEAVRAMPMVAALVADLGVSLGTLGHGAADEGQPVDDFGVFFVPEALGSAEVPGQAFVAEHGVRSVVGFGGLLPDGELFCVILFTRTPMAGDVAHLFRTVAVAVKLALLPAANAPLLDTGPPRHIDGVALAAARIRALEQLLEVQQQTVTYQAAHLERALDEALRSRAEAQREAVANEVLREVTTTLSAELETDRLVRAATDAATRIARAEFGAFCFQDPRAGVAAPTYTLSGIGRREFDALLDADLRAVVRPSLAHGRVVREGDVRREARPDVAGTEAAPPVLSCLAVPVTSRDGVVIGCFLLASTAPDVFDDRSERLVVGIAAQTAIALDNARLFSEQRRTALALQQSLLPQAVVSPEGLDIGHAYLPGGEGVDVGGDWYDVITIAGGRTAFVIGDVMGKGVHAAAVMGQLRTAIRAYSVSDLPPATLMSHLNRLVVDMAEDLIATCVYAVLDQTEGTLVLASAGHLPPALVHPDGSAGLPDLALGPPLGVEGAVHVDVRLDFPVGSRMLLFTDGLVEHRERDLAVGLDTLLARLPDIDERSTFACKDLITALLGDRTQDDDITLLMVTNQGLSRREHQVRRFSPLPEQAAAVRAHVERILVGWGDAALVPSVTAVVNELFINAVAHARTDVTVHLRRLPRLLIAEVEDLSGHEPRRTLADADDEHHRGLLIVEVLSTRWGTRRTETGKVVWAEFTAP